MTCTISDGRDFIRVELMNNRVQDDIIGGRYRSLRSSEVV